MIRVIENVSGSQKEDGAFVFNWKRPLEDGGFESLWVFCLEDKSFTPRMFEYTFRVYTGVEARFDNVVGTRNAFHILHFLILISDSRVTPGRKEIEDLCNVRDKAALVPAGTARITYQWLAAGETRKLRFETDTALPPGSLFYRYHYCGKTFSVNVPESMLRDAGVKVSSPIVFPAGCEVPPLQALYGNIQLRELQTEGPDKVGKGPGIHIFRKRKDGK